MQERKFKMYKTADVPAGLPPTLYRTTGEIRRDIVLIKEKIKDINERLNLRTLLMDILSDERTVCEPGYWIPELSAALREASDAQMRLLGLEEELTALHEELKETKWALTGSR